MVSKKSAEIINNLNIPMLIYEYQKEHTCLSFKINPVLYHGGDWRIKIFTCFQDPYDGYHLKILCIEKEFNPIIDELIIEKEVRKWIEELLDISDKIQNGIERIEKESIIHDGNCYYI